MEPIKVKLEPGFGKNSNANAKSKSLIPSVSSPIKKKEKAIDVKVRPTSSISQIPRLQPIDNHEIKVKKEKEVISTESTPIKSKPVIGKKKMMDFMLDVPELGFNDEEANENESDCSKFSSPFDSRVDTAGTNLTFMTRGTHHEEKQGLRKLDVRAEVGNPMIGDSSEVGDENNSFESSPCLDHLKVKRKQGLELPNETVLKMKRKRVEIEEEKVVDKEDESFDSIDANDGGSEIRSQEYGAFDEQRPSTPPKYRIDEKPIFEYMEGEDAIYYDIMGKKDNTEKLDENEKRFFDYVHLNFDQWAEQSEQFNKEYRVLMEKVVIARIKFDKRFQFLRKNLDEFALNLEKFGTDINKRSEILKEYCNKIVNEIE